MLLIFSYLAATFAVLAHALTPNLVADENLLNMNAVQLEDVIDANINPLDYLFNHSSEFEQIYSMFDVLLNSRKEYDFNMVSPINNGSIQLLPSEKVPSPPHMCVGSQDDLVKIWKEMNKKTGDKFLHFDSITLTQSAACSELDRLKTGILMIKQNFDEMLHKEISSKQYKELKVEYEHKFRKLQQQLNEARKSEANRNSKIELDSMQNELQVQQHQINNVLRKMESERRILNDAYIRLCIADLQRQNISSAVKAFMNITERSQIRRIIYAVYANKEENFKIIFEFVKQTNDLESFSLGYSSLFEQMKVNRHMNVMNLLLLASAIIQHRHDDGFKQLFDSLNESVKAMHQENDYDKFYSFMYNKNNESLFLAKDMIGTFVEGAYSGNIGNVGKILSMIPKLDLVNHRLHLINALLNEMKLNAHSQQKEIFMVIYQLTQTRNAVLTQNDKHLMAAIEQNLPDNVRDLIFTNLCIQNANTNEFLYSGQPSDKSRRYVFTSVINQFDDTFDFEMEFMDAGRKVLIKNSHYREHLYVTENGSPRTLLSWIPAHLHENTEAHFSLEIIDGPYFRVRSEHYGEYLYSPINKTHTESNRKVYFRREKQMMLLQSIILAFATHSIYAMPQLTFQTDPYRNTFTLKTPSLQQTFTRYYGGQQQVNGRLHHQQQQQQQQQSLNIQQQQEQPHQFAPAQQYTDAYTVPQNFFQDAIQQSQPYQLGVPQRSEYTSQSSLQQPQPYQQPQQNYLSNDQQLQQQNYFQQLQSVQPLFFASRQQEQQQQAAAAQSQLDSFSSTAITTPQQQQQQQQPHQQKHQLQSQENNLLGVAFSPSDQVSHVKFSNGQGLKYNF